MSLVSPKVHRALDFVTVVGFLLAPVVLGLTGWPAYLAYGLAVVHLGVTLGTRSPGGTRGPLPLPAHGGLELAVGVALLVLPWIAGWTGVARTFYAAAGLVILVVWALTDYRGREQGGQHP